MIYEVSFIVNDTGCANLIEAADKTIARAYFIQECLDGEESQFIGIHEFYGSPKPGMPIHKIPDNWKQKMPEKKGGTKHDI